VKNSYLLAKPPFYADLVLNKHFLLLSMLKTVVLLNILWKLGGGDKTHAFGVSYPGSNPL